MTDPLRLWLSSPIQTMKQWGWEGRSQNMLPSTLRRTMSALPVGREVEKDLFEGVRQLAYYRLSRK